jgi:protein gp37
LHNCTYCYARDYAELHYPPHIKFASALRPGRLGAPHYMRVPSEAAHDISYRNVLVCSMADLFGKWVPTEWIETVLKIASENPQWNFLFLTKFPQRMAEFEYPDNAWLGTTIDRNARVKDAERAMAKVKAAKRWTSIEPMLERIHLDFGLF